MRILAGRWKGRTLPPARGARPAPARLRTSLFGVLRPWLAGARVLDLCAGVGALGLEAVSQGARAAVLVERDPAQARLLEAWVQAAGAATEVEVRCADALGAPWPPGPYDLVLLDPPYDFWADGRGAQLLEAAGKALGPQGLLALKLPARAEEPAAPGLHRVRRVAQGAVAYVLFGVAGREAN